MPLNGSSRRHGREREGKGKAPMVQFCNKVAESKTDEDMVNIECQANTIEEKRLYIHGKENERVL